MNEVTLYTNLSLIDNSNVHRRLTSCDLKNNSFKAILFMVAAESGLPLRAVLSAHIKLLSEETKNVLNDHINLEFLDYEFNN